MNFEEIKVRHFGTHAVLLEWPQEVSEIILNDIILFKQYLKKYCLLEKTWELIPAYNSLAIVNDKDAIDFEAFKTQLKLWYNSSSDAVIQQRFLWRFPVCYDAEFAIDLIAVSEYLNCSVADVIKLHTAQSYTLYGIGFLPGFMYLGGLPEALEVPRKETPRLKVEKGAVGLAGKQTGIYPQESPGGWNIIGNCSVPIFDANNKHPCLVNVGDKIQFYSISRAEYDLHKIEAEVGIYKFEKIAIDA